MAQPLPLPRDAPPWRGFHHIAPVTPERDATIQFSTVVLGMAVTQVLPASPQGGRHCFIKPGTTESWGLHIFEQPDAQLFPYPADLPRGAFVPGATARRLRPARPCRRTGAARAPGALRRAGGWSQRIGPIENLVFHDNTGLLLEATWPADPQNEAERL